MWTPTPHADAAPRGEKSGKSELSKRWYSPRVSPYDPTLHPTFPFVPKVNLKTGRAEENIDDVSAFLVHFIYDRFPAVTAGHLGIPVLLRDGLTCTVLRRWWIAERKGVLKPEKAAESEGCHAKPVLCWFVLFSERSHVSLGTISHFEHFIFKQH